MAGTDVAPRADQIGLPFDGRSPAAVHPRPSTQASGPPAPVLVRHPRARRYVLRVREDGTVRVTIPRWGSKREALAFADTQRLWIATERRRVEADRRRRQAEALPPEVERAHRARATRELSARVLELASAHGLTVTRVSVRNQRWRWGSCARSGRICLNWRLVVMPGAVRDYVIIHELIHLKRLDHSPTFWKMVERACPEFETARRWLRAHSPARAT